MSSISNVVSKSIADQRHEALATLKTSFDINELYKLLPIFYLGRFNTRLDCLEPHEHQRPLNDEWVGRLSSLFETSTVQDHKFPGIAIADSPDWPSCHQHLVGDHPIDPNTSEPLYATIIEGQHRKAAKLRFVQTFGRPESDKVWIFQVYHHGMCISCL